MIRKIFTAMLTLALVLSFGLVTATPAGAVANPVIEIKALKWDGTATANDTNAYYNYFNDGNNIQFTVTVTPAEQDATLVYADFSPLGGSTHFGAHTHGGGIWHISFDWSPTGDGGTDPGAGVHEIKVYGQWDPPGPGTMQIGSFMVININPRDDDATLKGETTNWKTGIPDFTAATSLTFEKFDGDTSLGKLVIHGPVNVCDKETGEALAHLDTNLSIAAAEMSLNTATGALVAFHEAEATLYMYNLPFAECPSIEYTPAPGDDPQTVVQGGGTGAILNKTLVSSCTYDAVTGTLALTVNSWSAYKAVAVATVPDVEKNYSIKGSIKFFDWTCDKEPVIKAGTLHITWQEEDLEGNDMHKITGYWEPDVAIVGWPDIVPLTNFDEGYVGRFDYVKGAVKNTPRLSLLVELGEYCEYTEPISVPYVTYIINGKIKWDKKTATVKSIKCTINGWGEWGDPLGDGFPKQGQFEGKFTATP